MGRQRGETSSRLDRVARPDLTRRRDATGKEALYSTAPTAPPTSHLLVVCPRCDVETGISLFEARRLLTIPTLVNPLNRTVFGRCPTCERRTWLRIRRGQILRAFLDRASG